jgi:benzoylformate decarboxylase
MGSLTNAQAAHSPLIVTAGQQVRCTVGVEPLLTNVDAGQLPRPLVKWSYEPASAQDVPRAFAQAVFIAMLPPRGPVFLSVPYDDWTASVAGDLEVILARTVSGETTLPDAVIGTLLRRLASARSPVLVLGADVDAAAGQADAVLLAEKQNLPVWVAPSPGRCPFPTRHPNFRGVLTAGRNLACP